MSGSPETTNDPLAATAWAAFRTELRGFAGERLPAATVPGRIVVLPELPKLPNGKVDRSRLPRVVTDTGRGTSFVAPRNTGEARLAGIWADLLGADRVGVHDDFFQLGGNSLTAAQLAARVRTETGVVVNLRRFFERPTVADLAAQLGGTPAATGRTVERDPRSLPADQLAAEARLAGDVSPDPDARPPAATPYRNILLTGGTGYTGAYLIRQLLDRSDATVGVLVRAHSPAHGARRIAGVLDQYGLRRAGDEQRVVPVLGDLARPYLGLDRNGWVELADRTEMIVHNGALSSYALPYRTLKPVNVLGTQEVLRLACRRRIKPVHFVSSLAVYPGAAGTPVWYETEATDPTGVVGGYRQTKWVADAFVAEAGRRGIPVTVYRPGLITGAQSTGACATDTFINAAVKGSIQLGAMFHFDAPLEATPVDYFAAVVAHLALGGGWTGTVFNLPGARTMAPEELFDRVIDYGYPLRRLDYQDWYRELLDAIDRGEENELTRFLPLFSTDKPADDIGYQGGRPTYDTTNLRTALADSGITCAEPDQELFDRYLSWFVSTGYLPAPPGKGARG